jgi:hypothetical protein
MALRSDSIRDCVSRSSVAAERGVAERLVVGASQSVARVRRGRA